MIVLCCGILHCTLYHTFKNLPVPYGTYADIHRIDVFFFFKKLKSAKKLPRSSVRCQSWRCWPLAP
jgi:hypothetical protein